MNEFIDMPEPYRGNKEDTHAMLSGQITQHSYYQKDSFDFYARIINAWQAKNNFKTVASIDPARMKMTHQTLYQKLHHGRKWAFENMPADNPLVIRMKEIKIKKDPTCIRLVHMGANYIVDQIEDAIDYGSEQIDTQQKFIDWCTSDPVDCASWTNGTALLSDEDLKFFEKAMGDFMAATPPRFVVRISDRHVHVMSIKLPDDDDPTTP